MDTIQGIRTKVVLVSYSHGSIRVPLQQTFNITPRFTERTINEFDNLEPALIVTTYEAVDCTFEYLESDSKLVDAAINDVDPTATIVLDDPSAYQPVTIFANSKSLTSGKIFATTLIKGCMAKGSPYTEPVKEERRVTRDFTGLNVYNIKGGGIYYQRMIAANHTAPVFEQVSGTNAYTDFHFSSGPYNVNNEKDAELVTVKGVSQRYLLVLKNGVEVTTGFAMSQNYFNLTSAPAATDVWEAFYAFDDTKILSSDSSSSSSCSRSSSSSSSTSV